MIVLGIESSCDETSAAVVRDGDTLLSVVTNSSMDLHAQYGGVVPEIAARSHIECINGVITQAIAESGCSWDDIDAIAVTYGAGLGGSLLIGVMTARTLAIVHGKPLYAVNHVEGHVYANFLTGVDSLPLRNERGASEPVAPLADYVLPAAQPTFPLLALIVSGGHSQLALFRDHFDYTLLGQTQDDAIGEAFDKVAKIIGLPYPGGPSVEKKSVEGNPNAVQLPKASMTTSSPALLKLRAESPALAARDSKKHPANYDFSFSGVKTAVLRAAQQLIGEDFSFPSKDIAARLSEAQKADLAASFQRVAIETVVDKTVQAYDEFSPSSVVIAGGVAASPALRQMLADALPIAITYTDRRLCTDNAAMIATLGCFHMKYGRPAADPYSLEIAPNLSM